MSQILIMVVLGHFVGDYLLQSKKMAINKSKPGLVGLGWSLLHCVIYTLAICSFIWDFRPWLVMIIFLTHWPIDRYSLGEKWLRLIGGRNLHQLYYSDVKQELLTPAMIIDLSFACIVYTVVDNTLHLLLLWLTVLMFF